MDKVGLSHSTYKTINGIKGKNSFAKVKTNGKLPPGHPDYKLDLSKQSKDLSKELKPGKVTDNITSEKSSSSSSDVNIDVPKLPEAPDLPKVDAEDILDTADKIDKTKKVTKVVTPKSEEKLKTPAVFFVSGFELFDFSFMGNGLKDMTEAIEPARMYAWDQKEEMIEEIKKRENNQPVILVGQGFGADTAVEIAQELNSVENGFRTIDLLVTLNSIGTDNDFIPQNVSKNLNFLTADNGWFDDGPNIAANYKRTQVENYLRPEDHSDLDDSTDIQIEIMNAINNLV